MEEYTQVPQKVIDDYLSKNRLAHISNSLVFYKKDKDGNMVVEPKPWTHHSIETQDYIQSTYKTSGPPLYITEKDQQSLQNYIAACETAEREQNREERADHKRKEEEKKNNHLTNPTTIEFNRFNDAIFEKLKSQIKETIQWDDDHPFIQYLQSTYNNIKETINNPNNIYNPNEKASNELIQRSYIKGINRYLQKSTDTPLIVSNISMIKDDYNPSNIEINTSDKTVNIKKNNIIFVFKINNNDLLFSIKQMVPNTNYRYISSNSYTEPDYRTIDSIKGDDNNIDKSIESFFIFEIPDDQTIILPKENILNPDKEMVAEKEMATISNSPVDPPQKDCIGRACEIIKNITRRVPQVHSEGGKKTRKQMYSARSRRIITLKNASAFRKQKKTRKHMYAARNNHFEKKAAKGRHK